MIAPESGVVLADSTSNAKLQKYICSRWEEEEITPESSSVGPLKLFLSGGFTDEKKAILLTEGQVSPVPELESYQEEADTRMILHAMYSLQKIGATRIIFLANDTDIINNSIYYKATKLCLLRELWVRTGFNQ